MTSVSLLLMGASGSAQAITFDGAEVNPNRVLVKFLPGASASDLAGATELAEAVDVTSVQFRRTSPDYFIDWHTAPRKQFVITLSGESEVEIGDGTKIRLHPGHILLAEDVTAFNQLFAEHQVPAVIVPVADDSAEDMPAEDDEVGEAEATPEDAG